MAEILKIGILGSLPNGEKWSVNPVWSLPSNPTVSWDDLNTLGDAISVIAIPTGLKAMWNPNTGLTGHRLEARSASGAVEAIVEKSQGGTVPGTGTANNPLQTCVVASLRTPGATARTRGRLYWPGTGVSLTSAALRIGSSDQTTFQTGIKTYLSGIEAAIVAKYPSAALVVWSRLGNSIALVNRILIGDIPDVQRRRRDVVVENYKSVNYP